jgi:hypothetical protein
LVEDGYLKGEIATWLAHRRPLLQWRRGAGVTHLRFRAIRRRVLAEGAFDILKSESNVRGGGPAELGLAGST